MATPVHSESFIHSTTLWLGFSFAIFAFLVVKMGAKALSDAINNRIASIKKEIDTAENLRVEAQELLAQYQRKQRDAEKEAARILEEARKNAFAIKTNAQKQLKDDIKRKEELLEERIARMKEEAFQDIQAYATQLAIEASYEIIEKNLDKKGQDRLISEAIGDIKKAA